jgi:hypothetical protein
MNRDDIVQSIDEEIDRLQRARALMTGHTAPPKRGRPRGRAVSELCRARGQIGAD